MPTLVPSADEALAAIERGDAATVAAYLSSIPAPDHAVIRALARALSDSGETVQRLKFVRRRKGQPSADELQQTIQDAAIYVEVENLYLDCLLYGVPERGLRKTTIGIVAAERGQPDRTVRLAYERCKRIVAE